MASEWDNLEGVTWETAPEVAQQAPVEPVKGQEPRPAARPTVTFEDAPEGSQGNDIRSGPSPWVTNSTTPRRTVASGATRTEFDAETASGLNALVQQQRPYNEAVAFAEARGFPAPSPAEYAAALRWQQENPNVPYNASNPTRQVATTAIERLAGSGAGSALIGASEGATLSTVDEIGGAIGATVDTLQGEGSWDENYDRNVSEFRDKQAASEAAHPWAYTGGELVGNLVTGAGASGGLAKTAVGRLSTPAGLAVEGAILGGGQGAADAEGGVIERAEGGAIGAATGAVLGGGLGKAGQRIARAPEGRTADAIQTMDDVASINSRYGSNVKVLPEQISRKARGGQRLTDNSLVGGMIADSRRARSNRQIEQVLPDVAVVKPSTGTMEDAATQISRTGQDTNFASLPSRLDDRSERLYEAATDLAGDTKIGAPKTVELLNREIDRMLERPGKATNLDQLVQLRDNLAKGDLPIQALRDERTSFGRLIDSSDGVQRSLSKRINGTLTQDINDGLTAAGKQDAARAFQRADKAYSNRQQHLDLIDSILGKSEETVGAKLFRMTNNDGRKLRSAMRLMKPEEAQMVRDSLVSRMFRTADNGDSSLKNFVANWDKTSTHARAALFPGQHREDIETLVRLSKLADRPKVGKLRGSLIDGLLGISTAGKTTIAAAVSSLILSSPTIARLAVGWAKTGATRGQAVQQLGKILARDPAAPEQVKRLYDYLTSADSTEADSERQDWDDIEGVSWE